MGKERKIVVELRPALDGHYGIPQETRLLFSALAGLESVRLQGLLQMSTRSTLGGIAPEDSLPVAEEVHRFSRTVVSLKGNTAADWKAGVGEFLRLHAARLALRLSAWCNRSANPPSRLGSVQATVGLVQFQGRSSWSFLAGKVGSLSRTSLR